MAMRSLFCSDWTMASVRSRSAAVMCSLSWTTSRLYLTRLASSHPSTASIATRPSPSTNTNPGYARRKSRHVPRRRSPSPARSGLRRVSTPLSCLGLKISMSVRLTRRGGITFTDIMATSQRARPVALIVLDGWGYRPEAAGNAIALAKTPVWDSLWKRGSRTLLEASGLRVGLPAGQMGNSEVGHLNLGAGRVVMQDLVRISTAIADGSFYTNPALLGACRHVKANGGTVHIMGLIGTGGVHAIDEHLCALLELTKRERLERVAIHAFLDGRDTMPKSALGYMQQLLDYIKKIGSPAKIASVSGRYYSMDRDKRWDRTELAYRAIVLGQGTPATDPLQAIRQSYEAGKTDEFMLPVVISDNSRPVAPMRDGDAVICFNYRSDRMRQMVSALLDENRHADDDMPGDSIRQANGFDVEWRPKVSVTTLTNYD